jgi:uncharacterized lipoprotein YajG
MIRFRRSCVFVLVAVMTLAGCARERWPRVTDGGRYEVQNGSGCRAQVYTATEDNVTRRYLGQVRSGDRVVVTVPPRSEGTRVVAMALYPDGTNCDVGKRVRVRRAKP